MTALFLKILDMSMWASWIILAVLVLRLVLKKAPKWVRASLWCVVAVRLLCPFTIESSFSAVPLSVGSGKAVSEWMGRYVGEVSIISEDSAFYDAAVAAGRKPIPADDGGYYVVTARGQLGEPSTVGTAIMPVLAVIWAAGIFLLLSYTVISCCRLRRKVGTAVLYRDNIFQSENVSTPFVFGIVRPRIYLPFGMDGRDLDHVVAHEKAHIRRKDHWWKPLGSLLLTIHWFNPMMWLAYVLLCRDIELACDEKVIKELGSRQRADYTQVLLSCSVKRSVIAACPLAFGEVGVKERVKSVMNYKKPGFWAVVVSVLVCAAAAACFLTNPKRDGFDIKIVVPAGSQEAFAYSDEEISPTKKKIVISSGAGLGDTEVVLKPVEVTEENAYDEPAYLTPGMPVKMEAEKGAWFKIGINMQNPTDEDIVVYVRVENIEVRIADNSSHDLGQYGAAYIDDAPGGEHEPDSAMDQENEPAGGEMSEQGAYLLEDAISKAILEYDDISSAKGLIHVESHYVAYTEEKDGRIIVYLQAYESSYYGYNGILYQETGSNIPTAITFSVDGSGKYTLDEYWIPRDGSYFLSDLKSKFPQEALNALDDAPEEIQKLGQECYDKAMGALERVGGLELRISDLIEIIQSSPSVSSNHQDYIDAHDAEYQELLGYGKYTLHYCFSEFLQGNQTGLRGKIMEEICRGIISGWGFSERDLLYKTGQDWFDAFRENAENLAKEHDEEKLEKEYPVSWILLRMLNDENPF